MSVTRPSVAAPRILAAALALCLGVGVAAAQSGAQTYEVSVLAIRATKTNDKVSRELKPIAKELKKRFKYTGFKLEKQKTGKVGENKPLVAELIAGFKVKVTPLERKGNRIKLKVEVMQGEVKPKAREKKEKRLVSTTFTITRGRLQLVGGWRIDTRSEDVLIVAVSAR